MNEVSFINCCEVSFGPDIGKTINDYNETAGMESAGGGMHSEQEVKVGWGPANRTRELLGGNRSKIPSNLDLDQIKTFDHLQLKICIFQASVTFVMFLKENECVE